MMTGAAMGKLLDLTKRSEAVAQLVEVFGKRIIGQPEATEALAAREEKIATL
jgi:hypothetical protein